MTSKEILLKISNDKIWFNDKDFIDIRNTDIPFKYMSFISHRQIFWKVQLKNFSQKSGKLTVDIINYNYPDSSSFDSQKPKQSIKYLEFKTFDWRFLEPMLSSYQKIKFINQLTHIDTKQYDNRSSQEKQIKESSKIEIDEEPIVKKFEEEFAVKFNDSDFMLGYIKFSKYIKKLNQNVDFKIANENILPEFDNIKYWFAKKLEIKKFKVKATLL